MHNLTFDLAALTSAQRDGLACVACGTDHTTYDGPSVPVGVVDGGQVFACAPCVDRRAVMNELRTLAEIVAEQHGESAAVTLVRVFLAFLRDQIGENELTTLVRAITRRGDWQGVTARLVKLGAWEQPTR